MARHVMTFVMCAVLLSLMSVAVAQDETDAEDEIGATEEAADSDGSTVTLRFVVTVPEDTPDAETVYLCGDDPQMGNWDGEGLELQPQGGNIHEGELDVVRGALIQFKATRGSWQTVEKNEFGEEIENRFVIADKDKDVPVVIAAWSNGQPQKNEPTLTGDIRRHDKFHSANLDNDRTLLVYLPPGYEGDAERRYPVLYMHDGQNIFDASTSFAGVEWGVDEAAQRMIEAGTIEPIIIVGIYNNAERMAEYSPGPAEDHGTAYTRFVVEEVIPFINRTYRVDPDRDKTGTAGSSLGGLISLYLAHEYPGVFGRCGVVSPALGWQGRAFLTRIEQGDKAWLQGCRVWVDMGTAEGGTAPPGRETTLAVAHARDLAELLARAGLSRGEGYEYLEVEGGRHNEQAWAGRIDRILTYLYGR